MDKYLCLQKYHYSTGAIGKILLPCRLKTVACLVKNSGLRQKNYRICPFIYKLLLAKSNMPAVSRKTWWSVPQVCRMLETRSNALFSSCKMSLLLLTNLCNKSVMLALLLSGLQLAPALPEFLRHFLFADSRVFLLTSWECQWGQIPHSRQRALFPTNLFFQIKWNKKPELLTGHGR